MITRVKTVITTDIDIETLVPTHSVELECDDDLPEMLVASAAYGACRATMHSLRKKYPMVFKDEPVDEPDDDDNDD